MRTEESERRRHMDEVEQMELEAAEARKRRAESSPEGAGGRDGIGRTSQERYLSDMREGMFSNQDEGRRNQRRRLSFGAEAERVAEAILNISGERRDHPLIRTSPPSTPGSPVL